MKMQNSIRAPEPSLEEVIKAIKKSHKKHNIDRDLDKIYKERKRWNGGKGPFTSSEIKRRELILLKQILLERMINI